VAANYLGWVLKVRDIMGPQASKRDGISRLASAASNATGSLRIIRGTRWNVSHKNGPQIANVHTQLKRSRATQNINVAFD
ncbi:hypothetical protein L0P44_14645, partial [Streptococcus gordonii]|nr:hypothetical protein [Streptococcus gordonii]